MNPERERLRTIVDEGAELLKRCAQNDEAAFSRLYDLYGGLAYSMACRMLGACDEAEDAVQDAFLQAWNHSRDFDPARGSSRSWLVLMVRSRCLDRLRRRATRNHYEIAAAYEGGRKVDDILSDASWDEARLRVAVAEALNELPVAQRQVLVESFFEGLSQSDIADKLGVPLGTVKTRMRLAASKLKDRLKPIWNT